MVVSVRIRRALERLRESRIAGNEPGGRTPIRGLIMDVHALGCVSLVDKLHRLLGARADEEKGVELSAGPLDVPNMLRRDPGVYVDYTHRRESVPVWFCLLKPRNLTV